MKNKTKAVILISLIVFLLLTTISYYFFTKNKSYEFYAKVIESGVGYSIVEPLKNEKISKKYKVLEINIGGLNEGDLIKVKSNNDIIESYPPVAKVRKYEFIVSGQMEKTTNLPNKEEIIKLPENKENMTTTTAQTKKATITRNITTIKTITTNTTTSFHSTKDELVINEIQTKLTNIERNKNNKNFGETAKEYFISAVDFIFYDKDIKGVYFKDLSNKAKLSVIKIALKIDNIIDNYYPGYKEGLSTSYQNAKSKLIELYLNKTAEYCSNNDDVCTQAKNDFQDLKKSLNITWDVIKTLSNAGISKLKEWYEIYSGK